MLISIIIPTFNRAALLKRTLEGLCEQTALDQILEVLVIIDGSTDDSVAIVDEFSKQLPIRCICQKKRGVSVARNLGLSRSQGSIVLFLDDDVIPGPELVKEHLDFHLECPDKKYALLGYVTWWPDRKITPFMLWYGEYGALFAFALMVDGNEVDRRYLYTCNISFKTDFLRCNGGLNEDLSVFEDHELGYRLSKSGMRLIFRRNAIGYHNQSFTFAQACERLDRYSPGLNAFLATGAGKEMFRGRPAWKKWMEKCLTHFTLFRHKSIQSFFDTDRRLPHFVYRAAYWYFATLPFIARVSRKNV